MMRPRLCLAILLVVLPACGGAPGAAAGSRPNFLVILADDLGFSDLGCFGGEIRTPRLDRLAAGGLRFTRCYNSSRCCPSRASLLTGRYPHQAGIGRFVGNGRLPGYRGRLNDDCVTLAEALGPAGYSCYAAGKWHVNEPGPIERGFRRFYGFLHGYAIDCWNPSMLVSLPAGQGEGAAGGRRHFATDAITDHALKFLADARSVGHPWLLYVAYQAPHFPLQAPPELSARYHGIYQKGWDRLREERFRRMIGLGLFPGDVTLPPRGPIDNPRVARAHGSMTDDGMNPAWEELPADRRADLARRMAVYAAMVENMDANIGRIVDDLGGAGELGDTVIMFLTDNGACAEWDPFGFDLDPADYADNRPGRGINTYTNPKPNRLHRGAELETMGGPGSLFSYGSAWANLSNTPLRMYKHYVHEGGIRGPMILHWPAGVGDPGGFRRQAVHLMDVMPTCLELAGATCPEQIRGRPVAAPEGRSLAPLVRGESAPRRTLVFEHEGNAAILAGDWKLVGRRVVAKKTLRRTGWELYDLAVDPLEQNDLGPTRPDKVAELFERLEREAERTRILPAP